MEIKICDFCGDSYTNNSYSLCVYDNKERVDLVGHDECVNAAESLVKQGDNNKLSVKDTLSLMELRGSRPKLRVNYRGGE